MKIIKPSEMARIEKQAYAKGSSEDLFMENAGHGVAMCVQGFIGKCHLKPKILLLCGKGNNAGDAYVAGSILLKGSFQVKALAFISLEESSPLCKKQAGLFVANGGEITFIQNESEIVFGDAEVLVDGIFGTGFQGTVSGLAAKVIEKANHSNVPIIAIDIPSGLNGNTGEVGKYTIRAAATLFLGFPKSGCFVGEAWNNLGKIEVYDFGLPLECAEEAAEDFHLIEEEDVMKMMPPLQRTRHKYQAGYVVGLGGSFGMPGAVILAGYAALRAGSGIVRVFHPSGMEAELAGAPPELIREGYHDEKTILEAMEKATALFIGPGIGLSKSAEQILKAILPQVKKPCVIDAEALTLIASLNLPIPEGAILTPHHGEMKRLLHLSEEQSPWTFIEKCQEFVEKNKVTLVLKGAPTMILHPQIKPHVCPRGDPGMATAGSGDVLTGIIAAFLAQKKNPFDAAVLGVYLHAMAGEKAAEKRSSYSMVASDITEELPPIFRKAQKKY